MVIREAVAIYRSIPMTDRRKRAVQLNFGWVLNELVSSLGDMRSDRVSVSQLKDVIAEIEWKHYSSKDRLLSSPEREGCREALLDFFQWVSVEAAISSQDSAEIVHDFTYDTSLPFTKDELAALFAACSEGSNEGLGWHINAMRNRSTMLILMDTGMHPSQLCRLRVRDFFCREAELLIPKAGASQGYRTKLRQTTCKALVSLLLLRGLPDSKEPLIAAVDGNFLKVHDIEMLLRQLEGLSGVKDANPRRFRRTFASEYLAQNRDLYSLQDILGYRNLLGVLWDLELSAVDIDCSQSKASPCNRLGLERQKGRLHIDPSVQ